MIGNHDKIVLEFSGGKDSTALLYVARPYLDRITVIHADSGAEFPHVTKFVHETCAKLGAKLHIVHPEMPIREYMREQGLPSDIVPVEADSGIAKLLHLSPAQPLQSYLRCCGSMLLMPMHRAVTELGATLVLRGVKKCDTRKGVGPGTVLDGVEYGAPIWDWSHDDVFAYLEAEGVELPDHYATVKDSLDCWLCTAHQAHYGAEKLRYVREHYPDLWPELRERSRAVHHAVAQELDRLAPAVAELA